MTPPERVADVQEFVRSHDAIVIRAGGTKSPPLAGRGDGAAVLDLRRLSGVMEYSPDECVVTAQAGTRLDVIDAQLAAHGQYMPFDPPLVAAGATIGGTVAMGLSGSGRYRYGGIRDFVIGTRVVDGEGRLIRSGGKVVKNAAGFLLHHGMVGSLGQFGVLTEVTFKVFPLPEAAATLRVTCGSVEAAAAAVRRLEARRFDLAAVDFDGAGTMWIRVAGRAEALPGRMTALRRAVAADAELLEAERDAEVWTTAREWHRWGSGRDHDWGSGHDRPSGSGHDQQPDRESGSGHDSPTGMESRIKVAGLLRHWQQLRDVATDVRYFCGGALAWLMIRDLTPTQTRLAAAGLRGLAVQGPFAGARVGQVAASEFEQRVRSVLDPRNRFRAASHSAR